MKQCDAYKYPGNDSSMSDSKRDGGNGHKKRDDRNHLQIFYRLMRVKGLIKDFLGMISQKSIFCILILRNMNLLFIQELGIKQKRGAIKKWTFYYRKFINIDILRWKIVYIILRYFYVSDTGEYFEEEGSAHTKNLSLLRNFAISSLQQFLVTYWIDRLVKFTPYAILKLLKECNIYKQSAISYLSKYPSLVFTKYLTQISNILGTIERTHNVRDIFAERKYLNRLKGILKRQNCLKINLFPWCKNLSDIPNPSNTRFVENLPGKVNANRRFLDTRTNSFTILTLISYFMLGRAGRVHPEFIGVEPMNSEYSITACTKDPMTYVLEIKIHAQRVVVDAIQDVYSSDMDGAPLDKIAASSRYFGKIFDEINNLLLERKVQHHLNLDSLIIEDFYPEIVAGLSCEKGDPISQKTVEAAKILRDKYNKTIGLHIFIFSCPMALPLSDARSFIEKNEQCGRLMGILWEGTDATATRISELLQDAFELEVYFPEKGVSPDERICNYVQKCIARGLTDLGQKIAGIHFLKYTSDFSFTDFD